MSFLKALVAATGGRRRVEFYLDEARWGYDKSLKRHTGEPLCYHLSRAWREYFTAPLAGGRFHQLLQDAGFASKVGGLFSCAGQGRGVRLLCLQVAFVEAFPEFLREKVLVDEYFELFNPLAEPILTSGDAELVEQFNRNNSQRIQPNLADLSNYVPDSGTARVIILIIQMLNLYDYHSSVILKQARLFSES
jgi:hypothetical protein